MLGFRCPPQSLGKTHSWPNQSCFPHTSLCHQWGRSQERPGAWSCPPVHITCAMVNPPNRCYTDRHCPRYKKCCPTFCGRKCISGLPSLSYGRVSGAPPPVPTSPG
uniref:WAP domain-containing protein n=1 Tax=Buteo japonicus TaxID=224669 RepID=A0A8B9Z0Z0_9AVES